MVKPAPQVSVYQPRWSEDDYYRRPKVFDPDVAQAIIDKIMNGETVNAVCSNNRDYPLPGTFFLWLEQEPEYNLRYRRAKVIQAEVLVDGILEDGKAGTWDAGVRVNAGKIYAEKSAPERYGPRAMVITAPKNDEPPPVDHTAELRRKISTITDRVKAREAAGAEPKKPNGREDH
jgi:hypothetical protein